MMSPKKATDYIKDHAEGEQIPEQDMRDMVTGFYDGIKESMKNLVHPAIYLRGLGILKLRTFSLTKDKEALEKLINNGKSFSPNVDRELLDKMIAILEKREKDYNKKVMMSDIKKDYKEWKKRINDTEGDTTTGMEEQGTDC